jgi:hypothetical protein
MMKNLRDNWSRPNDVDVIYNKKEQTRREKSNQIMKCMKMN